jgi:hypothetical protein
LIHNYKELKLNVLNEQIKILYTKTNHRRRLPPGFVIRTFRTTISCHLGRVQAQGLFLLAV